MTRLFENPTIQTNASDGTVGKALVMLDLVASFERPVRFSEILSKSAYPKATVYRLLQTLSNQSMLDYNVQTATYIPGIRLVRLAHAAWRQSALAPIARPILDDLADVLGETLHLAQMDDGHVLFMLISATQKNRLRCSAQQAKPALAIVQVLARPCWRLCPQKNKQER